MDKVSIIIPTYNVEKYIDECLESICNQTYQNIEVIIVIDGATDKSEEIAREWSKKDNRISVLTQENAGSGPARNNGLKHATGKYVMFVDPDDWIEKEMVEVLVEKANTMDVDFITTGCICDYYDGDGPLIKQEFDEFEEYIAKNAKMVHEKYIDLFLGGRAGGPVCKLYKLDIIQKYKVKFPDYRRSQDIVFNYRYIDCIDSFLAFNSHFYHYRIFDKTYAKKIPTNYYQIVCQIYTDIQSLLTKWNVTLRKDQEGSFIKYFYDLIVWQISLGKSSEVMKDLVNNETILEIVSKSSPKGIKQVILNRLILSKKYHFINNIVFLLKKVK